MIGGGCARKLVVVGCEVSVRVVFVGVGGRGCWGVVVGAQFGGTRGGGN